MTEHKITLAAGATKVLHTAGMYCDRDIVVTADGGGKREGTAIPAGEKVERIYFNTDNTIEETNALLSQLTYVETYLSSYPLYPICIKTSDGASGLFVFAMKLAEDTYSINVVYNVQSKDGFAAYQSYDRTEDNGWLQSNQLIPYCVLTRGMQLTGADGEFLTEILGMAIGAENEKIKNVLSITPF